MNECLEMTLDEFASMIATNPPCMDEYIIDEFARRAVGFDHNGTYRVDVLALFMRWLPVEKIAGKLHEYYRGGFGLMYNGEPYAIWFNSLGAWISKDRRQVFGDSNARYITWYDFANRIYQLIQNGQYATQEEIDGASEKELQRVSWVLSETHRDMIDEVRDAYLTSLSGLPCVYPERTDTIEESLRDEEFVSQVIDEIRMIIPAVDRGEPLFRFGFYRNKIHELLESLERLQSAMREIPSCNPKMYNRYEPETFVTDDELLHVVGFGSGICEGKQRIYKFFTDNADVKDRVAFLKKEYGIGGRCDYVVSEMHDSKGIRIEKRYRADILLNWYSVERMIDGMIANGTYMTGDDLAKCDYIPEMTLDEFALQYAS